MLFGVGVSFCILYSIVTYLYVSCSGSVTLVWEVRACLLSFTCNYVVSSRRSFLFFSWRLGRAVLFYCGTPWDFHMVILVKYSTNVLAIT